MRARTVLFLKGIMHQRYDFFVEKLYGMRGRALAVHACPLARGRPRRLLDPALGLGGSAAK